MSEIQFILNHKETFTNHIFEYYPFSEDFIERNKTFIDWDLLSMNEKLPWSIPFIEKFYDLWNWGRLSVNESLPWSDELIESFIEKWEWDYVDDYSEPCLTQNNSIKWSGKIILKYPDKFRGNWISTKTELINECPEILDHFKDILWWEYISDYSGQCVQRFRSILYNPKRD